MPAGDGPPASAFLAVLHPYLHHTIPGTDLRLLALDGGVRGLSSLMILRRLMATIDPDAPPKPCDYFDMIGGTSTGGLIAIMLGRLRMTVDECIDAYTMLSDRVFEKKSHRVNMKGKLQGRFDGAELERAIKTIVVNHGLGEDALLQDPDSTCKVFVCATSKETGDTVCLANYRSPRSDNSNLLNATTIWQACRATSAATTFFDPITIGPFNEQFVDGAPGANNPVYALWNQAQDVWGDQLRGSLRCLISIGTGVPALKPVRDDVLGIWATLKDLAVETEKRAQQFHRDKSDLDNEGRYYRFNVGRGLEDIGLEESKKKTEIAAATRRYVESQAVYKQMKACAKNLVGREYYGRYRTSFSLQGVPVSNHFVARPSVTAKLEECLLPRRRLHRIQRRIFVLHGLGGIGKTQLAVEFARRHKRTFSSVFWLDSRSEDRLRQILANYAGKIPEGQIPERSRNAVLDSKQDLKTAVVDVLDWLAQPDNSDWLLIFDNVDQDANQGSETGAYDVRRYLPGDHGSVLITTRLSRLAQIGDSTRLKRVDEQLAKAIFQQWRGGELVMDEAGREILGLLDGLPLALAQAAYYHHRQPQNLSLPSAILPLLSAIGSRFQQTVPKVSVIEKGLEMEQVVQRRLLPHAERCSWWIGEIYGAGRSFVEGWEKALGRDHTSTLSAVNNLTNLYVSQGRLTEAESMYQRVREGYEKALGRDHMSTLGTVNNLGNLYIKQGRLIEAESMYQQALEGYEKALGQDHTSTLDIRALEGYEKALGRGHTATLGTVNNLGNLYTDQGRLSEAESMFQWALEGKDKALGWDHISTLNTVYNLGNVYVKQWRLTEAESMYQRALEGYEKALGRDHTSTLDVVKNLGLLYLHQVG
ncbi:hypothetical protein VTI74DRAFT_5443 [Chaetomium olivicolor]